MQHKDYKQIKQGFTRQKNTVGILLVPDIRVTMGDKVSIDFMLNAQTKNGQTEGSIGFNISYTPHKPHSLLHPDVKDAVNTAIQKCNDILSTEYDGYASFPLLSDSEVMDAMKSMTKAR